MLPNFIGFLGLLLNLLVYPFHACLATDIVFVGAGPIGLYTAVQTKLMNPELHIELVEKHRQYQRDHTLNLDQKSFRKSYQGNEEFQRLLVSWGSRVRTSQIETDLLGFATMLGIRIRYHEIHEIAEVRTMYPEALVIVGADGSHSIVREQLMPWTQPLQNELKYMAQVKYEVEGASRSLRHMTERLRVVDRSNHPVIESVGRETEGRTPVTLSMLINKEEYALLKDADIGFRNPVLARSPRFSDPNLVAPKLQDTIRTWIGGRAYETRERINADSIVVTPINLVEYFSDQVVFHREGVDYYLVGDAAFGVPFFRSINNGFKSSNVLSKVLSQYKHKADLNEDVNPQLYQAYVSRLEKKEKEVAHFKSAVLSLWESYVKPVQMSINASQTFTGGPWKERYLQTADQILAPPDMPVEHREEGIFNKVRCEIFRWI